MRRFDFEIAIAVWLASLVAAYLVPALVLLVIATTFNLWHQRNVLFNAGAEFNTRVRAAVIGDVDAVVTRVGELERGLKGVRDVQNNINTAHNRILR